MSYSIILFPRMEVSGANAASAWTIIGPPGPTAHLGFGRALALKCLPADMQQEFVGVGIVVHDYRLCAEKVEEGIAWRPHQLRAATFVNKDDYTSSNKHALSFQPTARCDLTVSLAVVLEEGAVFDKKSVEMFLCNARLAGGVVKNKTEQFMLCSDMQEVKNHLKNGYSLHARPDLMVPAEGQDALDALLCATLPTAENFATNPWVMPATMGFAAVTDICDRAYSRDGLPHAFAEPLVGLVQYKSLRAATIPIWKYQTPSKHVFLVGY